MEAFIKHTGLVAPLDLSNVDTDQIIPKQFLKRIERTGFGQYLFYDWRYLEPGISNPEFILNEKRYQNASILVAGANFGSGSSREHAPWALLDYGFKAIIAPSFADIFRTNCFQNGMLPIVLNENDINYVMGRASSLTSHGYSLNIDLENNTINDDFSFSAPFNIDPFRRDSLLKGQDEIARSLTFDNKIQEFESQRISRW
jgi:3-isopropylmalate/(R)-2-methylmalate dehydratase small subunit